jgi:hypothetical protein
MVHQAKGRGELSSVLGSGIQTTRLSTAQLRKPAILSAPEDQQLDTVWGI